MLLRRSLNYRKIVVGEGTTGEVVGVRRKDGTFDYKSWRGFIDMERAREMPGAIPVKLEIEAFAADEEGPPLRWIEVPPGRLVQGCLTGDGVRCVLLRGFPRLVRPSGNRP